MAIATGTIDDLIAELAELRQEHTIALSWVTNLEEDIDALERTLEHFKRKLPGPELLDPKILRGKTQIEALRMIAKKNNGELKVRDARQLLLTAGLIRNPKNASTIIYNVIRRSDLFDWISKGNYRLKSFKREQAKNISIGIRTE